MLRISKCGECEWNGQCINGPLVFRSQRLTTQRPTFRALESVGTSLVCSRVVSLERREWLLSQREGSGVQRALAVVLDPPDAATL